MHDLVRDLVRTRIGEDAIRAKQRSAVDAFAAICPKDGWVADGDAVGQYAALALTSHMPDPGLLLHSRLARGISSSIACITGA